MKSCENLPVSYADELAIFVEEPARMATANSGGTAKVAEGPESDSDHGWQLS
jgi:hypothetical protein